MFLALFSEARDLFLFLFYEAGVVAEHQIWQLLFCFTVLNFSLPAKSCICLLHTSFDFEISYVSEQISQKAFFFLFLHIFGRSFCINITNSPVTAFITFPAFQDCIFNVSPFSDPLFIILPDKLDKNTGKTTSVCSQNICKYLIPYNHCLFFFIFSISTAFR